MAFGGSGFPVQRRNKRHYWASVLALIGHLLGTGVIFFFFFSIGWLVSVGLSYLNELHQFPD